MAGSDLNFLLTGTCTFMKLKLLKSLCVFLLSPILVFDNSSAVAQTSGCGSGSSWYLLRTLTPIAANQFRVACVEHDACYDTYLNSKTECDKAFHNRMLGICARDHNTWLGRPLKIACNGRADAYYKGVVDYAQSAYIDAQREAKEKIEAASRRTEAASRNTITFKNSCSRRLQLAVHFKNMQNQWVTKAWYSFAPNESAELSGVSTNNRYFYYYAETTDRSNIKWTGNGTSVTIGGRVYNMKEVNTGSSIVNWTQNLTC
ncbi:DUF1036 domain-containing protein [Pseudanabaena sp. FACHB-1998]|uniref:DUF1036 domain-containing protein n=1 Tax=Pseudanabaena sp. FACHB-1998 TaxID=2692858 RepID=UPI001680522F|nr:DUF1036 domain-containing protein [Pseudanabaena sp. FACHB-1998]MBD2179348.1 DUF1036 domain-containing protein [Pseudanabaena sp. FACHB-1998]